MVATLSFAGRAAADSMLTIDADVPDDDSRFVLVPFDVPAGTAEIQIDHDDLSSDNILDWGLQEPSGKFRGWGGGNTEPAIVGVLASSRSYLTGPIPAGTWRVQIGKAKILVKPAKYHIVIHLRDAPTLPPQSERQPYVPPPALSQGPRWYAGDLHVHSRESGDASPSIDDIATFARGRGLDFIELSEHNTTSQLDYLVEAQSHHPDLLLLPGVEYTTYAGHANGIGATTWVDHKIGLPGVTIDAAGKAFAAQGAIFSINHPVLDLGDLCIGCAWKHDLDPGLIGGVEIATGGWSQSGHFFALKSIAFWNKLVQDGHHLAALGGSDDHRGGMGMGSLDSPIGDPTTMVYAEELSAAAILEGIRKGRTVVKMQGPGDPMIELSSSVEPEGDTVTADATRFTARVTGGQGSLLRFVHNGAAGELMPIGSDPFTAKVEADAPASGADRWRAEVWSDTAPRTVTSHLWHRAASSGSSSSSSSSSGSTGNVEVGGGCACRSAGSGSSRGLDWHALMGAGLLAVGLSRRRR